MKLAALQGFRILTTLLRANGFEGGLIVVDGNLPDGTSKIVDSQSETTLLRWLQRAERFEGVLGRQPANVMAKPASVDPKAT